MSAAPDPHKNAFEQVTASDLEASAHGGTNLQILLMRYCTWHSRIEVSHERIANPTALVHSRDAPGEVHENLNLECTQCGSSSTTHWGAKYDESHLLSDFVLDAFGHCGQKPGHLLRRFGELVGQSAVCMRLETDLRNEDQRLKVRARKGPVFTRMARYRLP